MPRLYRWRWKAHANLLAEEEITLNEEAQLDADMFAETGVCPDVDLPPRIVLETAKNIRERSRMK